MACSLPFARDLAQPIAIVPGAVLEGHFAELQEGGALPLETPPQGGHVSFVGARATNLDPCGVKLKATLRSRTSGQIAAEEERKVTFAVEGPDGSVEPMLSAIANAANVPACPDYFGESIVDVPHDLEVRVIDRGGRTATVTRVVVPRCQQTDPSELALCRCECTADYFVGRCAHLLDGGWLPVDASASLPVDASASMQVD